MNHDAPQGLVRWVIVGIICVIGGYLLVGCASPGIKAFDRCEKHFMKKDAKDLSAKGVDDGMEFELKCEQGMAHERQ
jgi:hypothetical protein